MSLRETNHALELTGGSRDALLCGADVLAELAHLDVRVDELLGGFVGDLGVDFLAGVGDVRGEEFDWLETVSREEVDGERGMNIPGYHCWSGPSQACPRDTWTANA